MVCKASFELHHNFPKLAEEAGFTFNTHRPRVHIEWSKIKLINIENLVRNRNFTIIEQHLNDILDCVIDLEFDVRILDEGFLKMFRLAQLAVEYQQFCRHYLDRSVFVLREEITSLLQELDSTKKSLKEKEEEIKKMKRKMKNPIRTSLPYGNDNIAKMILSALNQNKSEMFPSTSQLDSIYYNKCNYCDKAFLNQLYLKSHIARRHGNVVEVPQKDVENKTNSNSELNKEIVELKLKLKQMEEYLLNSKIKESTSSENVSNPSNNIPTKDVKDAEVWTNGTFEIIEQEKKVDQDTYTKEINLLRTQILDIINSKENDVQKHSENEIKLMEQLHNTIKNQGEEILALKHELNQGTTREIEERLKIEAQLEYWSKKAESQANDFKALLKKLSDVEYEAREYRAKVDTEKEKSAQLQNLLQEHLSKQQEKQVISANKRTKMPQENIDSKKTIELKKIPTNIAEHEVLKKLQERAQELLNMDRMSSDTSNTSDSNLVQEHEDELKNESLRNKQDIVDTDDEKYNTNNIHKHQNQIKMVKKHNKKNKGPKKIPTVKKEATEHPYNAGSPIKVVRAKLTEEVNNRLVSLGIDPLKNILPKSTFLKQRMLLQEQQDIKLKKYPVREKIVHSLMTHLDTNASKAYNSYTEKNGYMSRNKTEKAFSIASVISNVKTKAISLMKSNEKIESPKKSYKYIAKKASALLKSSPESSRSHQSSQEIAKDETNYKLKCQHISKLNSQEDDSHDKYKNIKNTNSKYYNRKLVSTSNLDSESSDQDLDDLHNRNSTNIVNLIKSPARKPSSTLTDAKKTNHNENKQVNVIINDNKNNDDSSDGIESLIEFPPRKALSEDNINDIKKTKGVLKNASSTSSLNKKKVIFDLDAIQIKSVSASPSQSTTEKSDNNEQYELGITNLDTEEWDLSSIENLILPGISKEETKSNACKRQSPKFTELKETIESKLMGRNQTLSTTPIGGVDVLSVPLQKGTSLGGSNTSLGSSILDDTDTSALQNQPTLIKPKHME